MANQSPRPILPLNVPVNFPTTPTPGKINILFDANKRQLYHKLSPYGYDTFLGIKTRQPFIYRYPDDKPDTMSTYASREFPFTRAIVDVERVSKWMISQQGILWMGKQFLLQTGNSFNETRIWNPTSPIVAAAMPLTLWTARPQRNIDTSDILGSFLGGLGRTIGGILGSGPKQPRPPAGTIGSSLPQSSIQGQSGGKGLLRAGTSNKAKVNISAKWQSGSPAGYSGISSALGQTLKTIFGNFFPERQTGVSKRTDEIMYGLMLGSSGGENGPFTYQGANGQISGVQQFWFGGNVDIMRKGDKTPILKPNNWKKLYVNEIGQPVWKVPSEAVYVPGLTGPVGFEVTDLSKPVKYGEHVGRTKNNDWEGSNTLLQYSTYVQEGRNFPTKETDKQNPSVVAMKNSLQKVIGNIEDTGIYQIDATPNSSVLRFNQTKIGYDRIAAMKKHGAVETQYEHSYLKEYRDNVRVLESKHTSDPKNKSMKLATSNYFDAINTLTVLNGEDVRSANWEEWKPYRDDLIAFYFYDVVNDKYVPFRATIRGLQETDSANWEELSFIGRADRLYSYSGFNRSLTFSFTVHISSVYELAPTWQRINYLMSLVKPASYTSAPQLQSATNLHTRYMIPPMIMVTIGDLYKNQPIVIGSAGLSIPDTALWETLNEENSTEWSYLANYIKAPIVGKLYGQLPKTIDISISAYLIEKERAIVGSAHFGHAPHTETYTKDKYRTDQPPDFAPPNDLSKYLVVYNEHKKVPSSPK